VLSQRAPGLTSDPVQFVNPGSGQVLVTVRTTPGDLDVPIVVHLVDWASSPAAFSISLVNAMFGGSEGVAMNAALLLPGGGQSLLAGTLSGNTKSVFNIGALNPYGMLVINPVLTPGDFDWDGDGDTTDYAVWRTNFGSTTNSLADANKNGTVDTADYVIWRKHLGTGLASSNTSPAAVPEPAGWRILLVLAALCRFNQRMNCSTKLAPRPTDS
jgi:hypothetical protein